MAARTDSVPCEIGHMLQSSWSSC